MNKQYMELDNFIEQSNLPQRIYRSSRRKMQWIFTTSYSREESDKIMKRKGNDFKIWGFYFPKTKQTKLIN